MNFPLFRGCANLYAKNPQDLFPKNKNEEGKEGEGGWVGQKLFEIFPKKYLFW